MRLPHRWPGLAFVLAVAGTGVWLNGWQRPEDPQVSAAVQALVQRPAPRSISAATWTDARKFYESRGGQPAWSGGSALASSSDALDAIRRAFEHGLSVADYGEAEIADAMRQIEQAPAAGGESQRASQIAALDVRITAALLSLGRDVAVGRTGPERLNPKLKSRRTAPDVAASLNGNGLKGWLDRLRPPHPEYAALQKALNDLYVLQKNGGWPAVGGKLLKPGALGAAVTALRQRLKASGEFTGDAAGLAYDADLEAAVRTFQERHGLPSTGAADAVTIAALNIPIGARIQQLAANLERWRWMMDDLGARHIFINIPAYELDVVENGKTTMSMHVIVGQADPRWRTPLFSAPMTNVIFNPTWNIPDTIADGEITPAAARDPSYLAKQGIEVLRQAKGGTVAVDPASVNWGDPDALADLVFRQRPGAANALGHIKFLLQNPFDVYLHDTPARNLFTRPMRALSHGCVRVQDPEALAAHVLRDDPAWDEAHIREAIDRGAELSVKIRSPLPVHVGYFTAWVDDHGVLRLVRDVYRYDAPADTRN